MLFHNYFKYILLYVSTTATTKYLIKIKCYLAIFTAIVVGVNGLSGAS